jgi:hypothetical protein
MPLNIGKNEKKMMHIVPESTNGFCLQHRHHHYHHSSYTSTVVGIPFFNLRYLIEEDQKEF